MNNSIIIIITNQIKNKIECGKFNPETTFLLPLMSYYWFLETIQSNDPVNSKKNSKSWHSSHRQCVNQIPTSRQKPFDSNQSKKLGKTAKSRFETTTVSHTFEEFSSFCCVLDERNRGTEYHKFSEREVKKTNVI